MKKILVFLLSFMMICTLFASCNTEDNSESIQQDTFENQDSNDSNKESQTHQNKELFANFQGHPKIRVQQPYVQAHLPESQGLYSLWHLPDHRGPAFC